MLDHRDIALRITALAAGGDGIGHLDDGRVVFVEGGVPGDLVELGELRLEKRMAHAKISKVLEASPDRVPPRCAHFGVCGGCAWQHIAYAAQLEAKARIVRDALERIGGIALDSKVEILASPSEYAYRARARLAETPTGLGYRKRDSRDCVVVDECPILVPAAESKLRELTAQRRALADGLDPARDESAAHAGTRGRTKPRDVEWEILAGSSEGAESDRVGSRSDARGAVRIDVLGESLRVSLGSFVQGNALLWDALADEVRSQCLWPAEAPLPGGTPRMVELYAGIGFLTLPLARAGVRGVVFESDRSALYDLRKNLERSGFKRDIEIVSGRVERRGDWARRFSRADLLLLDPPRIGLEKSLRETIAASGPQRVVYVSCDPATLARDLRVLLTGGYRLAHLRSLDLFPQTAHVEVVVRLERVAAQGA